jgi:hypothetical protein
VTSSNRGKEGVSKKGSSERQEEEEEKESNSSLKTYVTAPSLLVRSLTALGLQCCLALLIKRYVDRVDVDTLTHTI